MLRHAAKRMMMQAGGGAVLYADKIAALFGANLIGYWILGEAAGTEAADETANIGHLDYTGVTLGQPGIGDGNTCPLFNGTTDYVRSAWGQLVGKVNMNEGSMMIWAKVANAGVWTDGNVRTLFRLDNYAGDNYNIDKSFLNNTVADNRSLDAALVLTTGWFHVAVTWSVAANKALFYCNGVTPGAGNTYAGLTHAAGDFCIGVTQAASLFFSGYLAHMVMLDRPATGPEIVAAATV